MGLRKTVLATGEIYHVFNRSPHKMPIFKTKGDYSIFIQAMEYYLQAFPPTRYSIYKRNKNGYSVDYSKTLVKILNFCIMPTHFHFTLKQDLEGGIKDFIRRLTVSYAHYFNKKYDTSGSVFTGNFKARRVEDEDQLLHLSRYIHLNPVTSYLVEKPENFLYSSYRAFIGQENLEFIDPSMVLGDTKPESYQKFVLDQIDYQRRLKEIEHVIME